MVKFNADAYYTFLIALKSKRAICKLLPLSANDGGCEIRMVSLQFLIIYIAV